MIGKEIADAIAPIVMWLAIVSGGLLLFYLILRRIRKSAKTEERAEIAAEATEGERDARKSIKDKVAAMRDRLRARARRPKLPDDEDHQLPGSG